MSGSPGLGDRGGVGCRRRTCRVVGCERRRTASMKEGDPVGVWHSTIVERALGDTRPGSAGRARTGLCGSSNGPPQTHPARAPGETWVTRGVLWIASLIATFGARPVAVGGAQRPSRGSRGGCTGADGEHLAPGPRKSPIDGRRVQLPRPRPWSSRAPSYRAPPDFPSFIDAVRSRHRRTGGEIRAPAT